MRPFNARAAVMTCTLGLLVPVVSLAQDAVDWKGAGGWGARAPYVRMYDAAATTTVSGEIVSIGKFAPAKGMSYGVHIEVATDKEKIPVHLGPGWYLENQDVQVAPGDKVEIKGSRIEFEGKPALIAAEVRKGDDVLVLRDENGFPAWSGWRRR
jgi:hypothetical protein